MTAASTGAAAIKSLTSIVVSGSDARAFLQGQLSNDLGNLTPQRALLAGCHSAHGRVQAIATLLERDGSIVLLVATPAAKRLMTRLRHFVMRSKVILTQEPDYVLAPLSRAQALNLAGFPLEASGACVTRGELTLLRWWGGDERYLSIAPRKAARFSTDVLEDLRWRHADIAAGIPHVYPETHEIFVAQMLNLDLLGGLSFAKGCYTGQEIIARTHYRGLIKRRMTRFSADCAVPPPGTRVLHAGEHAGEVVDACVPAQGTGKACELLAVVSLDRWHQPLELDGIADSSLTRLSLPYVIPEVGAA
jgi:tRNA-modifying protein YgfZ